MPECLDNMPWRSLKGLGDMAPDFLKLGDFKNVRLTDGTMVTVDCARGLVRAMP